VFVAVNDFRKYVVMMRVPSVRLLRITGKPRLLPRLLARLRLARRCRWEHREIADNRRRTGLR